jgi:hypothetical protein
MSLQMQRSQHSFVLDALTQLKDAGAVTTSAADQVGGSARVLDLNAYTEGFLVVDISAMDFTTGDETYVLIFQLSSSATFASDVHNKAAVAFGLAGGLASSGATNDAAITTAARKRTVVQVDNEHLGTVYRYARTFHVVAGTTPSIDYVAFLTTHLVTRRRGLSGPRRHSLPPPESRRTFPMAARVTLISTDGAKRLDLYAVDAKELLSADPTGWKILDLMSVSTPATAPQAPAAIEDFEPKLDATKVRKLS